MSVKVIVDGREVDEDAAINLMDDEVREQTIYHRSTDRTPQQFVDDYCELHLARFGETFKVI